MKIVADAHIPYVSEFFGACGDLSLKSGRAISAHDLKDAEVLLVRSITHVNQKLLKNTSVRFVGSVTAGKDHLDTDFLDQEGITWCAADGFNAPPVADYIVSVIAALQKKQILEKKNLNAAVIGVGNVGTLVAERFKTLDFDVQLCDPFRAERDPNFQHEPFESLENLDVITLHVPLTRQGNYPTHHFIDEAFLQKQKPGCVLINASRGAVIDSKALKQKGKHLFWCLDVFEHEPNIDRELLERTIIATPHIAGYSVQSKIRGIDMVYQFALQHKIIESIAKHPIPLPYQKLRFTEGINDWRDVALGVFNPLLISAMMRSILLPASDHGQHFDEMRNQFNYRYEFAYSKIDAPNLQAFDRKVLNQLTLKLEK